MQWVLPAGESRRTAQYGSPVTLMCTSPQLVQILAGVQAYWHLGYILHYLKKFKLDFSYQMKGLAKLDLGNYSAHTIDESFAHISPSPTPFWNFTILTPGTASWKGVKVRTTTGPIVFSSIQDLYIT